MHKYAIRALAALAAMALAPHAATAQEDGPYVSVSGLYVLWTDSESTASETPAGYGPGSLEFDGGFGVLAAIGYEMGLDGDIRARVEGEFGWRQADYDGSLQPLGFSGDLTTLSLMVNAILSFDTDLGLRPYAGAGLGWAGHDVTIDEIEGIDITSIPESERSDEESEFAYQGIAGLGFAVSDQVELRGGYRYFGAGGDGSHNFEAGILFRF